MTTEGKFLLKICNDFQIDFFSRSRLIQWKLNRLDLHKMDSSCQHSKLFISNWLEWSDIPFHCAATLNGELKLPPDKSSFIWLAISRHWKGVGRTLKWLYLVQCSCKYQTSWCYREEQPGKIILRLIEVKYTLWGFEQLKSSLESHPQI